MTIDPYTGKPLPPYSVFPFRGSTPCECGRANLINRCIVCGAPVCCPACCAEATEEWFAANAAKESP